MKTIEEIIDEVLQQHLGKPYTGSLIINSVLEEVKDKELSHEDALAILWSVGVDTWNRFEVFLKIVPQLKFSTDYWATLRDAYINSDNLYRLKGEVRKCFQIDLPCRDYLMNEYERLRLNNLPDVVTIYRGMTTKEKYSRKFGISWTLDESTAEFFVDDYTRNRDTNTEEKTVVSMEIQKSNIIAYFDDRNEDEVIYLHQG